MYASKSFLGLLIRHAMYINCEILVCTFWNCCGVFEGMEVLSEH